MFNVDDLLKDLEAWNEAHEKEIHPMEGEKQLEELRQAVNQLKEERKAKANKNKEAMKDARDRSQNIAIDKYVALVQQRRREFNEYYY